MGSDATARTRLDIAAPLPLSPRALDPATAAVLAEARSEVDVRQAHRTEFGYLALVLRRG